MVDLHNPTDRIAFFVELSLKRGGSGLRAAPVLWSDNYVTLMPGERREIQGEVPAHALGGEAVSFHYSGINVAGR